MDLDMPAARGFAFGQPHGQNALPVLSGRAFRLDLTGQWDRPEETAVRVLDLVRIPFSGFAVVPLFTPQVQHVRGRVHGKVALLQSGHLGADDNFLWGFLHVDRGTGGKYPAWKSGIGSAVSAFTQPGYPTRQAILDLIPETLHVATPGFG